MVLYSTEKHCEQTLVWHILLASPTTFTSFKQVLDSVVVLILYCSLKIIEIVHLIGSKHRNLYKLMETKTT